MNARMLPLAALAALATGFGSAQANEFDAKLRELASSQIAHWIVDPVVLDAIRHQNAANAGVTAAQIDTLDKTWRAEVGTGSQPTIDPVIHNPASDYLRARRDDSAGLYTEVFVMDANGLNVASSDVTSDYWQGDEDKWQQTFAVGPHAVHISEVELDESTQTYQSQVSVAISDPDTGAAIGAVTVGINVEHLN